MTYYQILEIPVTATQEDIKSAYRKMAKKYHPDLNRSVDPQKMKDVNDAYATLSNPSKRKEYDLQHGTSQSSSQRSSGTSYGYERTTNQDPFSGFDGSGFDYTWWKHTPEDLWNDLEEALRRKAQQDQRRQEEKARNRRPLSVAFIKRVLREDLEEKMQYNSYSVTWCDLCTGRIERGEKFSFMGNKKKMCNRCKKDIVSHL